MKKRSNPYLCGSSRLAVEQSGCGGLMRSEEEEEWRRRERGGTVNSEAQDAGG